MFGNFTAGTIEFADNPGADRGPGGADEIFLFEGGNPESGDKTD